MLSTGTYSEAKQPWVCPRCGKVNAPWMDQCTCANTTIPLQLPKVDFHNPFWQIPLTGDPFPNQYSPQTISGSVLVSQSAIDPNNPQ